MDQHSRTEFPLFETDGGGGGAVTTFFNKLLNLPAVFSGGDTAPPAPPPTPAEPGREATVSSGERLSEEVVCGAGEGRSLQNVVRRISSLVALGSSAVGTRYADTELARYWMPDDISRECLECESKFSALRRRHHCRVCGQIFCSRCCSQRIPGQICGCAGGLRVCTYCCKVVLSYLQERDVSGDIPSDLRSLQENLQVKFPERTIAGARPQDNFLLGGSAEEPVVLARAPHAEALQDVFRHVAYALPTQQHRYRLVRYSGVWRGCDIMQWIMDNTGHTTRSQASTVCQGLLTEGYMECVTEQMKFADYALYRRALPLEEESTQNPHDVVKIGDVGTGRKRLVETVSSYCLDLNLGESSARLIRSPKCEERGLRSGDEEMTELLSQPQPSADQADWSETGGAGVAGHIAEAGREHLSLMMRQCLARECLSPAWLQILFPLCLQAADAIVPDLHGSEQDVRAYVQVKKVSGGAPGDSRVISGVVLSKNVTHRAMPRQLVDPAVLLLDCSIAYQRVEGKLTSLEPVMLQEHEYLVRMAARVLALRPGVVLTRGTVARAVQDELRSAGVALATSVRERALRRAARCLNADILTSVDSRIGTPRLGTCSHFYVENLSDKTLMVMESCAEPGLGCCVVLRGADVRELARVKRVVRFMLLACYNWRLERAFLADVGATLPEPIPFTTNLSTGDVSNSTEPSHEESTDPSPKASTPLSRRSDADKTVSAGVVVRDFSDPLRAPCSASQATVTTAEDEVFAVTESTTLTADTDANRWWADDIVLSMSPHVNIAAPFLETEAGRRCPLRCYFKDPLFRASSAGSVRRDSPSSAPHRRRTSYKTPLQSPTKRHEFSCKALTASAEEATVRASLAHYRAVGGRINTAAHKLNCPQWRTSVVRKTSTAAARGAEEAEGAAQEELEPLAPENHQRLNLLIYSFGSKSANVPDFCVNPWIVRMEMYGRHDISLGAFLDKYCFDTEYRCPSRTCHAPMLHHVRRFIHGDGSITITCNTVGNSCGLQRPANRHAEQTTWWSRCECCAGVATRTERLSRTALSLSLAKYLELRLLAPRYTRAAACQHSLNHAHAHYFAKGLTTACFRYSKIKSWDMVLPPSVIHTQYDTRAMRDALLQQANDLLLRGHEIFSAAGGNTDGIGGGAEGVERDYLAFKQHVEQLHSALTSAALRQHTHAGVVRWLWTVSDCLVAGDRLVRDAHERYAAPVNPPTGVAGTNKLLRALHDATAEEKSDAEASIPEGGTTDSAETASRSDVEPTGFEEDEERGDKKTVRAILSQLLSNSQPANQGGMIISGGVLPVVVFAGQVGSVVAAGLASVQYRQQLQVLLQQQAQSGNVPEQEESSENKEKSEEARSKSKCSDHVEVLLKDGLLCRVYYAAQFQKLRELLLAPLSADNVSDSFSEASGAATTAHEDDGASDANQGTRADNEKEGGSENKHTVSGSARRALSVGVGPGSTELCDIEEGFIRSLAHCVAWTARGGKSGSTFCKTKDDRYVLKEMSKQEWQQFLEFAQHYFSYVLTCYRNKLPTLLARIVGVYSVGGAGNGVLVMENLFYDHGNTLTHRFDLKGASRNRLAADTAHPDAVLMDENLLNMRWETPLYVQAHTAEVLWAAIERDTNFLASHSIMDYSLLLGVDSQHGRLVLGIIDYIRTFTWDKKLEHLVKKNLGAGQPTIVSPAQYRDRFCAAAAKYFLHCPNRNYIKSPSRAEVNSELDETAERNPMK